jgi:hypothetical protein
LDLNVVLAQRLQFSASIHPNITLEFKNIFGLGEGRTTGVLSRHRARTWSFCLGPHPYLPVPSPFLYLDATILRWVL